MNPSIGEVFDAIGSAFEATGKGEIVIIVLLSAFFSYGLSKVFGQVRSMSLITHMMMM